MSSALRLKWFFSSVSSENCIFVCSLIWSLLLPQWSSQRHLKFSMLSITKYLIIGGEHWRLQSQLWNLLWERWRDEKRDERTKEKNKKQSKSIFQIKSKQESMNKLIWTNVSLKESPLHRIRVEDVKLA